MNTFFSILKQTFSNIIIVFKNFFHWTISKIIIVIFTFFLAVVSFIPFFIVLVILGFIDPIPWGEVFLAFSNGSLNFGLISAFSSAPVFFVIETLITIIGLAFAIGVYHYKEILLFKLIESYTTENRLKLKENISIVYFKRYIQIFPKIFLYLSFPIIGYIIYVIIIFLLSGGVENILATVQAGVFNYISILLLIGFLISAICFFYIYYRFIFIYPILALNEKEKSKDLFQTSRDLTRGPRIFIIVGVIILYGLIIQPTSIVQDNYQEKSYNLDIYYQLRLLEQIPKNASFLDYGVTDFNNYEEVTLSPTFIGLDSQFKEIDILNMQAKVGSYEFIGNVLYVFNFLVFYGIFEVILFTLYSSFVPKEKETSKKSRIGKLLAGFRKKNPQL